MHGTGTTSSSTELDHRARANRALHAIFDFPPLRFPSDFRLHTSSRADESRDFITGTLVDRHPARFCHLFFPPFLTAARRARLVPRESMHLGAHQGRTSLFHHLSLSLLTVACSKFIPHPPLSSPLNRMGKFSLLVSEGKSKKKKIYIFTIFYEIIKFLVRIVRFTRVKKTSFEFFALHFSTPIAGLTGHRRRKSTLKRVPT